MLGETMGGYEKNKDWTPEKWWCGALKKKDSTNL